jgi:hypothetical protein
MVTGDQKTSRLRRVLESDRGDERTDQRRRGSLSRTKKHVAALRFSIVSLDEVRQQ